MLNKKYKGTFHDLCYMIKMLQKKELKDFLDKELELYLDYTLEIDLKSFKDDFIKDINKDLDFEFISRDIYLDEINYNYYSKTAAAFVKFIINRKLKFIDFDLLFKFDIVEN